MADGLDAGDGWGADAIRPEEVFLGLVGGQPLETPAQRVVTLSPRAFSLDLLPALSRAGSASQCQVRDRQSQVQIPPLPLSRQWLSLFCPVSLSPDPERALR